MATGRTTLPNVAWRFGHIGAYPPKNYTRRASYAENAVGISHTPRHFKKHRAATRATYYAYLAGFSRKSENSIRILWKCNISA